MKKQSFPKNSRVAASIFLLALLLSLLTTLFSCAPLEALGNLFKPAEKEPMPEKAELYAALEGVDSEASYRYAATYLERWGFSYFDSQRMKSVEYYFDKCYVEELLSPFELAMTVAYDFLDNHYDNVDLTDLTEVTTAIIDSYVAAIGDDYAVYRLPEESEDFSQDMSGEFCGIGVTIEFNYIEGTMLITSVMKDSPAEAAGFLPGDYIIGVDGKSIDELGYDGTANAIKGEEGTDVSVTVLRGESEITLTATRAKITEHTVYYEILEDNIGYIQITAFKENTAEQFGEAMDFIRNEGASGVIFDLRSNGGGYLFSVLDVLEYLVPEDVTMTSYTYLGSTTVLKTEKPDKLEIPCVVLCNGYTASAAELFTSAVRDYGEMGLLDECVVGTVTYGKGIMQQTFPLGGGASITMTIAYYYTPLGENYHGVGITPDTEIEIGSNGDAQLDAALSAISAKISK